MKEKKLLSLVIVGLLTFISGWFLHSVMRPSNQTKDPQIMNAIIDTVSIHDGMKSNNFAHTVSGHFVLTGSNCAGFNFINNEIALWTNEIACGEPDTLKIRWLSDSAFMARSTLRIDKNCSPKVDIYKVVFFDGRHLTLKSIWTGWNDAKDESLELFKQTN